MPLWNLFLVGAALPPDPPAVTAPAPCPTPPEYTDSDWEMVWDERRSEGEWVTQRLHYSRTRWDECRGTSKTETTVEGPYRLWPAVPENRVADVSRPQGPTDGVSGSPLRSSNLPESGELGAVGPTLQAPGGNPARVPENKLPTPSPFFPGFALFVGSLVASLVFRRRKAVVDPVEEHVAEPVQGPPVPRIEARTLDRIAKGEEWVPTPVEAEWFQAFFAVDETGYGPLTQEAVKEFQRRHGIEPDPKVMVGPNTYRALWEEHLDLIHERWRRKAEGRRVPDLDRLLGSPMPPDLRQEMLRLNEAHANYWKAIEGRYQAILRRNPDLVKAYEERMEALHVTGVKVSEIPAVKEKYQPLVDAIYEQADTVKQDANDGDYAKLLAMLAAADAGKWDEIATVNGTLGDRWKAAWLSDGDERGFGGEVADMLRPYTLLSAVSGTPSPASLPTPVPVSSTWMLQMPFAVPRITTVYNIKDSLHPNGHDGIDLVPVAGRSTIMAAQQGTVVFVGMDPRSENGVKAGYGNVVIVDHGNGYLTMYGHMAKIDVKKGDIVNSGDPLGLMGSTGFSTSAHLHFMLLKGPLGGDSKQPWVGAKSENPWLLLPSEGWGVNFRRIIEDAEFRDTTAMTLMQVRQVLAQVPLFKEYASGDKPFPVYAQKPDETIFNAGRSIDVAKVVYEEATKHHINPMLLLARMQTEAALLTKKDLTPDHPWVIKGMGYGVPDVGGTDYSKTGLDFQIQNAARLLDELFSQAPAALDKGPVMRENLHPGYITLPDGTKAYRTSSATIRQGDQVTIVSEQVAVENRATWALYQYTPHMIDLNHVLRDSLVDSVTREKLADRAATPETPDLYTYRNPERNHIGGGNLLFKQSWELVKSWL